MEHIISLSVTYMIRHYSLFACYFPVFHYLFINCIMLGVVYLSKRGYNLSCKLWSQTLLVLVVTCICPVRKLSNCMREDDLLTVICTNIGIHCYFIIFGLVLSVAQHWLWKQIRISLDVTYVIHAISIADASDSTDCSLHIPVFSNTLLLTDHRPGTVH